MDTAVRLKLDATIAITPEPIENPFGPKVLPMSPE